MNFQGCSNRSCCWSQFIKSLCSSGLCTQAIVPWNEWLTMTCKHWQLTERGSCTKLKANLWWKHTCISSKLGVFLPLPQETADASGVHVVVHTIKGAFSSCSPDSTFLFLCTAYTNPGPLGWRDQNVLLPPSLFVQAERKGLVLCVMVSALTLDAFWTNTTYSKICLFRKAPLNNLVEMSDTSRPIYHNELQMPRMDNNALFIRRQEQRRQEGSIYSVPPMAHSSFSLREATKSFRAPQSLTGAPLFASSCATAVLFRLRTSCIFKKAQENKIDLLSEDHLSGSHQTGTLRACTKCN